MRHDRLHPEKRKKLKEINKAMRKGYDTLRFINKKQNITDKDIIRIQDIEAKRNLLRLQRTML